METDRKPGRGGGAAAAEAASNNGNSAVDSSDDVPTQPALPRFVVLGKAVLREGFEQVQALRACNLYVNLSHAWFLNYG